MKVSALYNQIIGRVRNSKGQFVDGNPYRILNGEQGTQWFPDGWDRTGTLYNRKHDVKKVRRGKTV